MLLGVEAPAVRPIIQRAGRRAASPRVTSSRPVVVDGAPTGRCRISSARHQALRLGDVERPHALRADPRQVAGVAAVVAAHDQHQVERLLVEQRDDRVLPLLRGAADRVERAEMRGRAPPRRSGRASPRGTSPRSPATPTSASSSGWRTRPARDRPSGSNPGRGRAGECARGTRRGRRRAGCSRRRCRLPRDPGRRGTGPSGISAPATPSRASPRASPCRE